MKKISIVLFSGIIVFSCNEKKETSITHTDWSTDNLKGEVQKAVESPYKVDSTGKMGDMDSCCLNVFEYDNNGNVLKATTKDSKGNVTREQTFTKYPNGLFKEIITMEKGKMTNKISIQVDKDGKYATAMAYDSSGKLSSFYKDIVQNDYNQLTAMKEYKPDSTLKSSEENTYDKQFYTGGIRKDSSGKQIFKGVAKLDDKMNTIEFTSTTTKMDANHKDSTTTKVTKNKYDSYDDQGNWTQRTEMDEKGKPTKIYKREITYFKK